MTQTATLSLTARLRKSISAEHDAIEQTPFSVALINGGLSRDVYALNLAQMLRIHHALEDRCEADSAFDAYFSAGMRRQEVIRRDLKQLGFDPHSIDLLDETQVIVRDISERHAVCPLSLLGGIYVLEGSRMGSMVLAKPLAKCLQISGMPGSGIDYHVAGARETPARLKLWKQKVDQANFDSHVAGQIEAFAVSFMKGLLDLYAAMPIPDPAIPESNNRHVA